MREATKRVKKVPQPPLLEKRREKLVKKVKGKQWKKTGMAKQECVKVYLAQHKNG